MQTFRVELQVYVLVYLGGILCTYSLLMRAVIIYYINKYIANVGCVLVKIKLVPQ